MLASDDAVERRNDLGIGEQGLCLCDGRHGDAVAGFNRFEFLPGNGVVGQQFSETFRVATELLALSEGLIEPGFDFTSVELDEQLP